ncbi:hypothetical protein Y1Q_0004865 [Alligator mississippiensis]|nr:hypothetical protein Y1Q_0004865 [Alligator mississippiensis]
MDLRPDPPLTEMTFKAVLECKSRTLLLRHPVLPRFRYRQILWLTTKQHMLEPADLICSPSPFPAWEFKGTQSQTYAVLTTPSFATLKEGVTKKFAVAGKGSHQEDALVVLSVAKTKLRPPQRAYSLNKQVQKKV